jgi:hypothetical protein
MFLGSRYIALVPTAQKTQLYCWLALTAQKTTHGYCCRVATNCRNLCVASEARRGYSFSCCARHIATSYKHSFFCCCAPVSRLRASTVLALAKHATISFQPKKFALPPASVIDGKKLGITNSDNL